MRNRAEWWKTYADAIQGLVDCLNYPHDFTHEDWGTDMVAQHQKVMDGALIDMARRARFIANKAKETKRVEKPVAKEPEVSESVKLSEKEHISADKFTKLLEQRDSWSLNEFMEKKGIGKDSLSVYNVRFPEGVVDPDGLFVISSVLWELMVTLGFGPVNVMTQSEAVINGGVLTGGEKPGDWLIITEPYEFFTAYREFKALPDSFEPKLEELDL